jgi:hypothetical protein
MLQFSKLPLVALPDAVNTPACTIHPLNLASPHPQLHQVWNDRRDLNPEIPIGSGVVGMYRRVLKLHAPRAAASITGLSADTQDQLDADYFYKFWLSDGLPMAVAFQRAMLETRDLYSDPF